MKIVTSSAVALILSAGLAGAAQAAQSEIDLSSLTNANTLEAAGVEFTGGDQPGVRLKAR